MGDIARKIQRWKKDGKPEAKKKKEIKLILEIRINFKVQERIMI